MEIAKKPTSLNEIAFATIFFSWYMDYCCVKYLYSYVFEFEKNCEYYWDLISVVTSEIYGLTDKIWNTNIMEYAEIILNVLPTGRYQVINLCEIIRDSYNFFVKNDDINSVEILNELYDDVFSLINSITVHYINDKNAIQEIRNTRNSYKIYHSTRITFLRLRNCVLSFVKDYYLHAHPCMVYTVFAKNKSNSNFCIWEHIFNKCFHACTDKNWRNMTLWTLPYGGCSSSDVPILREFGVKKFDYYENSCMQALHSFLSKSIQNDEITLKDSNITTSEEFLKHLGFTEPNNQNTNPELSLSEIFKELSSNIKFDEL